MDKWNVTTTRTDLYMSNLEGVKKVVEITERIPVTEIEHVRINLLEAECKPAPKLDDNGFCTWTMDVDPHSQSRIHLRWEVGFAPDVQVAN